MEFQDSLPERRNLMVISIGIIIYFLAEGSLSNDTLKLQLLSIEFQKTNVIYSAVWISFLWCLYRYHLKVKDQFRRDFYMDLQDFRYSKIIRNRFEKISGIELAKAPSNSGNVISHIQTNKLKICVQIGKGSDLSWKDEKKLRSVTLDGSTVKSFEINSYFTNFKILSYFLISKNSFSELLAPYLLAIFAVGCAIKNLIAIEG